MRAIIFGGNFMVRRQCSWGIVFSGVNYPQGNCPGGNFPREQLSGGNFPLEQLSSGAIVRGAIFLGAIVLEHFKRNRNSHYDIIRKIVSLKVQANPLMNHDEYI